MRPFSERVFVLRSVRLFYTKSGAMRFVSHLDMTRFMMRAIARAQLPVWHTEGFNPRPYVTFALPLSLGFESSYEVAEVRITDDRLDISQIPEMLNAVCPEHISFFDAREAVQKTKFVAFADYTITFDDGGELKENLENFLKKEVILSEKRTKKGEIKQIDLAPHLEKWAVKAAEDGNTVLHLTLPAGSTTNINPELLLTAFFAENEQYSCYKILRTAILNDKKELFV